MASNSYGYAESLLRRAFSKLEEARIHLKRAEYAEAISSAQECLELSIKAVFLVLKGDYPKKHEFTEEEFEEVLRAIPKDLSYIKIYKLYLYSKFWSQFYTVAKYGLEKLGLGPEKLFDRAEAKLALKHAENSYIAAEALKDMLEMRRMGLT